ncbi:MAG: hypothetical protein QXE31_05675 [Candidatus Woesearchaeota archaeon]
MAKKSQISTQVFIYLMAAIIIGLLFIVGYRSISTLLSTQKSINIESFQKEFEDYIYTYATQYNSQKKFTEKIPPTPFDEICFADSKENNKFSQQLKNNDLLANYPLIQTSILNDAEPNIFLLKNKKILSSFYVDKLDVLDDFLCIKSKERKELWIRGTGKVAELYTNP